MITTSLLCHWNVRASLTFLGSSRSSRAPWPYGETMGYHTIVFDGLLMGCVGKKVAQQPTAHSYQVQVSKNPRFRWPLPGSTSSSSSRFTSSWARTAMMGDSWGPKRCGWTVAWRSSSSWPFGRPGEGSAWPEMECSYSQNINQGWVERLNGSFNQWWAKRSHSAARSKGNMRGLALARPSFWGALLSILYIYIII